MPTHFTFSYDICYDDYFNEWAAIADLFETSGINTRGVTVTSKGIAPHGWPVMEVAFKDEEQARRFTAAYVGVFDLFDQDVDDYLWPA
jgi:hypothetical protein